MGDDLPEGCLHLQYMQHMLAGGQNNVAKILRQVRRLPRIQQQKQREEERVVRQRERQKSKSHVEGVRSRKVRFQLEQHHPKGGNGLESLRRRLDSNLKLQQQILLSIDPSSGNCRFRQFYSSGNA